jgi:hypothetical protein
VNEEDEGLRSFLADDLECRSVNISKVRDFESPQAQTQFFQDFRSVVLTITLLPKVLFEHPNINRLSVWTVFFGIIVWSRSHMISNWPGRGLFLLFASTDAPDLWTVVATTAAMSLSPVYSTGIMVLLIGG